MVTDETGTDGGGSTVPELADLVLSADDAIVAARLDGTVCLWNTAAERLYGYAPEEAAGQLLPFLVTPEHLEEWEAMMAEARAGRAVAARPALHRTKDGTGIDVIVTLSPVRGRSGVLTGMSMISRRNTDQKTWAAAMDATIAQMEEALAEARLAQETCRRFLADAAHQLRTPMTGIQASAETLLRGAQQAQRDKLLANLVRETSRSSRLIADLLRLAHLDEAGSPKRSLTDLVALCRDEADRAWSMAPHLDFVLRAAVPECEAEVEEQAIREIVANLLDNARRHARARIEISVETEQGLMVVKVSDDGPGLAEGLEEKVFERFASLDGMGGSGLGLPIARELARAHDGDVIYDKGSFLLRFPFR